jgi:hypothetical protein
VKPRDAIAYHTQTIYTPRKGEVSEGMKTARKVRLMETLFSDHLLFLRRKSIIGKEEEKKRSGINSIFRHRLKFSENVSSFELPSG